jgi:hypothetical protein
MKTIHTKLYSNSAIFKKWIALPDISNFIQQANIINNYRLKLIIKRTEVYLLIARTDAVCLIPDDLYRLTFAVVALVFAPALF